MLKLNYKWSHSRTPSATHSVFMLRCFLSVVLFFFDIEDVSIV